MVAATVWFGAVATVLLLAAWRARQTYRWVGGSEAAPTSWIDPNNWEPAGVPGAADEAVVETFSHLDP